MNSLFNTFDTLYLIVWAVFWLIFFSFLGFCYSKRKVWKFADAVNILLSICGLILFFSEKQNIRNALPLIDSLEQVKKAEDTFNKTIKPHRLSKKNLHYHFYIFQRDNQKYKKWVCANNAYSNYCQSIQLIQKEFENIIPYQKSLKNAKKVPFKKVCNYVTFAKNNYDHIYFSFRTQKGEIISKKKISDFSFQCNSYNGQTPYSNRINELARKIKSIQNNEVETNPVMLWVIHDLWAFILSFSLALMMGKWMCDWKQEE